jgi:hypothetical protein
MPALSATSRFTGVEPEERREGIGTTVRPSERRELFARGLRGERGVSAVLTAARRVLELDVEGSRPSREM